MRSEKVQFLGSQGMLAARLDQPDEAPRTYALFAHCFTCNKDIRTATHMCSELTNHGIAVLRFDFSGLGNSEGDFSNTNFSSNVTDLVAAARWLHSTQRPPHLLVGHSLGGAAVLAGAKDIPEAKAVVTVGAPAEPSYVVRHFTGDYERIDKEGEAEVFLAGRPFRIKKQFLDDIETYRLRQHIGQLRRALLVCHSPIDDIVGIENATEIFNAAKHPKSFLSLDGADHMLRGSALAAYAGRVIAAWAGRYV
jgi:alpha/beta superfamily hydrolase